MDRPILSPALSGLLGAWLPRQRWFPVKSAEFTFEPAGGSAPRNRQVELEVRPGARPAFEVLLLAVTYPTPDGQPDRRRPGAAQFPAGAPAGRGARR